MTSSLNPSLRKAAILLRSLDAESATALLSQLSAEEARAVREAMKNLGELDPLEQQELREELRAPRAKAYDDFDRGGVELDFSSSAIEPAEVDPLPTAIPPMPAAVAEVSNKPFAWLEGGDLPSLSAILEREHLSTVAVVLSHLSPDLASQVLDALPSSRRAAALERLADLGESDRDCLEVIERQLADWIAVQKAERQRRADRLQSIQAILSHSAGTICESVMAEIARHDKSLAEEIGPVRSVNRAKQAMRMVERTLGEQAEGLRQSPSPRLPEFNRPTVVMSTVQPHHHESERPEARSVERRSMESAPPVSPVQETKPTPPPTKVVETQPAVVPPAAVPKIDYPFERITQLNQRQLAELFSHCDSETVVKALAGATQEVSRHVERLLPKSVVRELNRRMHTLSSVRLSELSDAQSLMAQTAARLYAERSGSFAA